MKLPIIKKPADKNNPMAVPGIRDVTHIMIRENGGTRIAGPYTGQTEWLEYAEPCTFADMFEATDTPVASATIDLKVVRYIPTREIEGDCIVFVPAEKAAQK